MDVPQYVRVDNDSRRVGHQSQVADPGIQRFLGPTTVWSRQDIEIDHLVGVTSKDGRIAASLNTTSSADVESNGEGQVCHLCGCRPLPLYTSLRHLSRTFAADTSMDNDKNKKKRSRIQLCRTSGKLGSGTDVLSQPRSWK